MKRIIQLEETGMLALSIYALYFFKAEWWGYLLLALGPDISMLGYLGGNRSGAIIYNLFHHKGTGVALFIIGIISGNYYLLLAGIILFGHSSLDRLFGYGLKYFTGFGFTHLGEIGNQKKL